jgi:hypothetical protein
MSVSSPAEQRDDAKRNFLKAMRPLPTQHYWDVYFDRQNKDQQLQQQQQQQQQQNQPPPPNSYDNTGGLARRPSKRVANPPPSIRTGSSSVSQISIDQQQQQSLDWSQQQHSLPSPLQGQGLGDIDESYYEQQESNTAARLHGLQDLPSHPNTNTIRRVPTNELQETSPYGSDDHRLSYHQQQAHVQIHAAQDPRLYGQANFDTSPQQPQQPQFQYSSQPPPPPQHGQYQGGTPQIFTQHLANPQHQNAETVSQLSHESPITDSDQRSATFQSAQTSPAAHYAGVQSVDHPLPAPPTQQQAALQSQQQQQQQQQQPMAPGGQPPARRSQETDKAMRSQSDAPPGPPPGYRHNAPAMSSMNPLPPPPATAGGPNSAPGYRASGAPTERGGAGPGGPAAAYEVSGGEAGRNSPQPPNPDRDGADAEKAFKDLRK